MGRAQGVAGESEDVASLRLRESGDAMKINAALQKAGVSSRIMLLMKSGAVIRGAVESWDSTSVTLAETKLGDVTGADGFLGWHAVVTIDEISAIFLQT